MKFWRITAVLVLAIVAVGIAACNALDGNTSENTEQTAKVERGNLTVVVSGSGNIEVSKNARLSFGTSGRVEKVDVEEGQTVEAGQVLAKLETGALELATTQAELAVSQAELALTQAQLAQETAEYELDRLSKLPQTPESKELNLKRRQVDLAKQQVVVAGQSLELARKSLEQARERLNEAIILAPFAGTVDRVNISDGDLVTMGAPAITLVETGNLELRVKVDEIDVVQVKPGQKARVEIDAFQGAPINGQVVSISTLPTLEGQVVVYFVRIDLPIPGNAGVRAGMSATADIIIAERNSVLLVPDRAVRRNERGETVVDVTMNGQTQERPVVTGLSDGLRTEVVQGLSEGETVVERRTRSSSGGVF